MPTSTQVADTLALPATDFNDFSNSLENLHGTPHVRIGGTMATAYSPNHIAAFFAHHGYIDKLWNDWQKKSPAHFNAYANMGHNPNTPLNHAWGRSAGEVNDLFATGVEYVTVRASELGSGHLSFPSCMLFVAVPWLRFSRFSLADIDKALMASTDSDKLIQVPQFAHTVLTDAEMRTIKANLDQSDQDKIEAATRSMRSYHAHATEFNSRLAEKGSLVEKFEDDIMNELGYDYTKVIELFDVQPIQEDRTSSKLKRG